MRWCAVLVLAMACSSRSPEPPPTAEPPVGAQENNCPARFECHSEWRTCRCTFTARGDVQTMEADFEGDGRPNFRLTYVYDAEGRILRWEDDQGADGTVETPCVFDPPCPPPHPNSSCFCYGAPRDITRDEFEQRLEQAGDRAQPIDPAEAQRIMDSVSRGRSDSQQR
jgi:hypothetical protein